MKTDSQKRENLSFDTRRIVGSILGPALAVIVWCLPIEALSTSAHNLLSIMALVATWWITEPVPIPVTSLLGPTLCVIFEVAPATEAFANFANPMIFLFLGGFLIAKGMIVNGLDKRIAYKIMSMRWVGDSPRRIFLAIGIACMLCSGWISNTATAAMMLPITLGLLESIREMLAANGKHIDLTNYKYATGVMLMTAYACSIGGVLTPIGTPSNIIMIGFLNKLAPDQPTISFFDWMSWGFVAMIAYFIVAFIVLWKLFPSDVKHIKGAEEYIRKRVEELGKWTPAQRNTLVAFGVALIMWITPSILNLIFGAKSELIKFYDNHFPEVIGAMVGGLLLFLLPANLKKGEMTLSWKDGMAGIDWGTLLLFGGGLSLGSLMYSTGLSDWIGDGMKALMGGKPSEFMFIAIFCTSGLLLAEFTSHTAAVNLMGTIAIGTAVSLGFNPIPVAVGLALASSLGFMMPVSTPPNAIVYSSGYVPITKMIKSGFIIDVFGIICVTIPVVLYLVKLVMGV